MLALPLISTACRTQTVIIPSDKAVVAMPHGKAYAPQVDGYFVPNERMDEILNALDKARILGSQ